MNGDIIWTSGLDSVGDTLDNAGDSMGMSGSGSMGLSCSGSGLGSSNFIPWRWCWSHQSGSRAFPKGRLLGWYFGGDGGHGGIWVTGSSGPGHGVATRGAVGSTTGDVGIGVGAGPGADEGNAPAHAPDVRCADGVCPRPHADFLLSSLAFFRIALSVSTNSLSFNMFPYFE